MFIGDIYRKAEIEISKRLTGAHPRFVVTNLYWRYKKYGSGRYIWQTVSREAGKRVQEKVQTYIPGYEASRVIARRVRTPNGYMYKMYREHIHRMNRGYDIHFTETGRKTKKEAAIIERGETGELRVNHAWHLVKYGILPRNDSLFSPEQVNQFFDTFERVAPTELSLPKFYTNGQARRHHYSYSRPSQTMSPDAGAAAQPG